MNYNLSQVFKLILLIPRIIRDKFINNIYTGGVRWGLQVCTRKQARAASFVISETQRRRRTKVRQRVFNRDSKGSIEVRVVEGLVAQLASSLS